MDWSKQCAAVIPCLNEANTIAPLITQIQKILPRVIVVDDGSTDQTPQLAAATGASIVTHPHNRGKGAALQSGLQLALNQGFAWALTLDGDGQHAPSDIPAFFTCAEQTAASLIIGNRMAHPKKMPKLRFLANRWSSRCISQLTRCPIPDSQCGFRLLRLEVWASLTLRTHHFETESELLVRFLDAGEIVEFVPIQVIYGTESSRIRPVVDAWRWWRWWRKTKSNRQTAQQLT